jgi:HD superfamily phosphohydrolase
LSEEDHEKERCSVTELPTRLLVVGLDFEKRIRDPIHGDIELTSEEIQIVDTEQFQRLRGIRQLGPAYLVYPAATHTRFEHVLGTLYMAQKIINGVNANALRNRKEKVVSETGERIIRVAALLHDVTHEPFGHSIEGCAERNQ